MEVNPEFMMRLEGLLEMADVLAQKYRPDLSKDFKDAFDEVKALNDEDMREHAAEKYFP